MSDRPRALPPVRRNEADIGLGFILRLLGGIGAILLALIALAYVMFPGELADRRFAEPFPAYPAPQLQTDPAADMRRFRDQQLHDLDSAGWQDRAAGTVHIPIAQAMRALAAEGIPDWPTASAGDRR